MKISLIAAMAKHQVIGKNNQLPWHLPADLKHFKAITMNKPVVMGRKTWESLGRPLPGRENIVVTTQQGYQAIGATTVPGLSQAFDVVKEAEEIMIIGGATLYAQALPVADKMYLTFVNCECEGDVFFPKWDEKEWKLIEKESHQPDEKNPYAYEFLQFERASDAK